VELGFKRFFAKFECKSKMIKFIRIVIFNETCVTRFITHHKEEVSILYKILYILQSCAIMYQLLTRFQIMSRILLDFFFLILSTFGNIGSTILNFFIFDLRFE